MVFINQENVKLRPEILKNSQDLIEEKCGTERKPLDLVFHGGSGSEKKRFLLQSAMAFSR